SNVQVGEQQSPAAVLPWSHVSPASTTPLPQTTTGSSYSRTRWLLVSATYVSPSVSTATALGLQRLVALAPPRLQSLRVKLPPWPTARSAAPPLLRGGAYSRTRLLVGSAT